MDDSNEKLQDENPAKKFRRFAKLAAFFSGGGCFVALGIFVVFLVVLIFVGVIKIDNDDSISQNCINIKSADEICSSISLAGYGTMSVDDYIAGVVQNEFGGASTETLKAQAVAARSYGLAGAKKDGNGNCYIGDTSEGFQTYNPNPSQNVIDAVNATSGMILVDENGNVARSEYSSNSLPAAYSTYGDMITMSERNLQIPRDWWSTHKTCSDSTLNSPKSEKDAYGRTVYGCGHGRGMGQIAAWYLDMVKGFTYDQILEYFYGQDSEYKWSLASTKGGGSKCTTSTNGGFQPLDHYTLTHEGLKVLNHKLTDSEIKSLNSDLQAALDYAGHGNGEAVASVGQALVYWFEKQGVYLQYRWGGGHDYPTNAGCDLHGSFVFANPNWGSTSCGYDEHDSSRVYYGMDCSGFVGWATRTACNPNFGAPVSGTWTSYGKHISLSEAQPGDVIADGTHIQLVIKNNGDGTVIVAEEGGSSGNVGSGLVFSHITAASHRPDYVISMKDWYSKNCVDIHSGTGASSSSSGKGKILLLAGHSYSPYCSKADNECRGVWETTGYAEETETRTLVKLLKQKLIKQGYKSSDIDIVNELLGENFNDTSTSKSLYVEIMNDTNAYRKIDFSKYKYAIEIHFNGSDSHKASGVCSVCTNGDCGISSSINSKVRSAVKGVLGKSDNGVCNINTHTFNLFKEKGIPFTYLETEYYDNKKAMDYYSSNKEAVAEAIAKVIRENYP